MSNHAVEAIDFAQLSAVVGGQTTKVDAHVKKGDAEAGGTVDHTGTPERRSDYTTCLNDMGGGGGRRWFAPSRDRKYRNDFALKACVPLAPKAP
ncbi:MAG TPA: hypothetical protein VH143_17340 [Kofleriaceae bacterium]|jgi:hypothetical protein|nr:hypothetical protein [Kofleriaceae bacterium]